MMPRMDLREHQAPLKERYREDPGAAPITLTGEPHMTTTLHRGG